MIRLFLILLLFFSACQQSEKPPEKQKNKSWISFQTENTSRSLLTALQDSSQSLAKDNKTEYRPSDVLRNLPAANQQLQSLKAWQKKQDLNNAEKMQKAIMEKRLYDGVQRIISDSIQRKALLELAKKQKLDIHSYVENQILQGKKLLSENDFLRFLEEKGIDSGSLDESARKTLWATAEGEVRDHWVTKYLQENLEPRTVSLYFAPPKAEVGQLGDWPLVIGSKDAKVTVRFFGNFRCPSCVSSLIDLAKELEQKKSFNINFRFTSPSADPIRRMLGEAALCIYDQGVQKFFDFFYNFGEKTGPFIENEMLQVAKDVGVNVELMNRCRFAGEYKEVLQYHYDYSQYLGVQAMPTMIIDDQVLAGPAKTQQIEDYLPENSSRSWWKGLWLQIRNIFSFL